MTDTIIFDLDGTLLNTLEDLTDSVNYALASFGLPTRNLSEIKKFVGNGVELLIKRAVAGRISEEEEMKCLSIFKQYYNDNMNYKTRPYEGILELVRELLKNDYHIAIVSNKFDSAVKDLNRIYFESLFPVAIGSSKEIAKKPAPDSVFEALRQLGAVKENALYMGDSDVDVKTAKNSGIPCVGVTWGFRDEELLRSMGAEYIIHKPEQLLDILDGRNMAC